MRQSSLQCLQHAFQVVVNSLHLDALKPDPWRSCPASGCLVEWLQSFFSPAPIADAAKMAGRIFATNTKTEFGWLSFDMLGLLKSLAMVVPDAIFQVDMAPLCLPGATAPTVCRSKAVLDQVGMFFASLSQVLTCIAFLAQRFEAGGDCLVAQYRMKPEIEVATAFLKTQINELLGVVDPPNAYEEETACRRFPWLVSVNQAREWLSAARIATPAICKHVVAYAGESLSTLTEEVSKVTPRYDHIITQTKFHLTPARKMMQQQASSRAILNERTVSLYNAIADLARLRTQWALTSDKDSESIQSTIDAAQSTFEHAKVAITIVAALVILLETKGSSQSAAAQNLLHAKRDVLPKALADELDNLVTT